MNIENILNIIPISEGIEAHIDVVREELFSREVKLMRSTLYNVEDLGPFDFSEMIEEVEELHTYLNQNEW
jgi:hypothetical protein